MKHLSQHILTLLFFIVSLSDTIAQKTPDFINYTNHSWVESTLQQMTLEQKIGQLFIIQAYSKNLDELEKLIDEVNKFQVGGIIFMQGTSTNQVKITNELQRASKIPLLVTMDAEWGPGFRLDDAPKYPVQMALGAIQEDSLIYKMGLEVGQQLKRMGVHVNFAPVADVNNNPENPVINYRSFGENPKNVSEKAWLYAKGMQDAGVLAVAKHFPGHGDTKVDSHLGLPVITHDITRLNEVEIFPFKSLIENGIGGIMTAHLQVQAMDSDRNTPASLSSAIINDKLVDELKFEGLIISDAMNMQGITKQYSSGESAVKALQAGNDMLEIVPNLAEAISAVKFAVQNGEISQEEIDKKCRKILALKKWAGLDNYQQTSTEKLEDELKNQEYALTKRLLHEQSITILRNENQLMPLQKQDTLKIAVVSIGKENETTFQNMVANYMDVDFFNLTEDASSKDVDYLIQLLKPYNLVICGIHSLNLSTTKNYGVETSITDFIKRSSGIKTIVALFGNPYALNYISGIENSDGLLITYQENIITQELAAQSIFGAINATGKLPVNVNSFFKLNDGIALKKNGRLKYTIPEEVGISSEYLEQHIDSLAELGLTEKAYPGCQVLIAIKGKVIFHKCYGFHTYDTIQPVVKRNIYDWASMTKITGTLPALIKLHGDKKFNIDLPFSFYWTDFRGTEKENATSREVLAHQARLLSGVSFWEETLNKNGQLRSSIFKKRPTGNFDIRVSSNLYMNRSYIEKMYAEIKDSRLYSKERYTYSDLAFFIFPKIIEEMTGEEFERYLKTTFYKPLGASTVTFNPYKYFPLPQIIPTENDDHFRDELLRGYVHDEGAAMMGGVSGNAGLFGTANDLAKIMQMYLQNGNYGEQQFLDSASLAEFTKIQFPKNENRRGLGFDKPYIDNNKKDLKDAYPAVDASTLSFGHSGYTGTFTWADPVNQVLFIFLSNRVYPTRNNSKITELNLRPAMHQVIYDSIKKGIAKY